jgi:hypothetical protein
LWIFELDSFGPRLGYSQKVLAGISLVVFALSGFLLSGDYQIKKELPIRDYLFGGTASAVKKIKLSVERFDVIPLRHGGYSSPCRGGLFLVSF